MLKIDCNICFKELKEPGGLLFAPPEYHPTQWTFPKCVKLHICVDCFDKVIGYMDRLQKAPKRKKKRR